jgi:hypothetical protein
MITSYEALRNLTDEELVQAFDDTAPNTQLGLSFFREELARRENALQYNNMLSLTKQMRGMTIIITVLTIINVIVVVAGLAL